jgi:predicted alpha-1,6-mannanase (GH76 family)
MRSALVAAVVLEVVACSAAEDVQIAPDADVANTPSADAAPPMEVEDIWGPRADDALEAMLLHYWTGTTLEGTAYWTFAQAWDAVLDGVERTGRYRGWIETMYVSQNARGWSSDFYDDENWMALALIRAYELTGTAKYLDRAELLFADIDAAWDTTCCGSKPGGFWWDRDHTQKATASNAGPVITGVRLWKLTQDANYLDVAKRAYAFWRANMMDPTTYQVFDHIKPDGTITKYRFTYNEGLVIGAALALHAATGDMKYLDDARQVATWMIANETKDDVLFDGTNAQCGGDCQQFKGIGFRYLRALQVTEPRPEVAQVLDASARAIWDQARTQNNLFAPDWNGPTVASPSIEADSSAVMALELHAIATAGAPVAPGARYEAEDGVLHSIDLEASHGPFDGWAYLAGWNGDGKWVDFHVHTDGASAIKLRYAAGAGDASRLIYVDGSDAIANQLLPSTGSWDTWVTMTIPVSLAAGDHTISIIYNKGKGSSQYVNLDWIELQP